MGTTVRAEGLVKKFGDVLAVDGIDLEVAEGTVLGLLGPNGSGKTTTVRMLSTLLAPTEGRATVGGHDVVTDAAEVRSLIGLTGQYAAVDPQLTGVENLEMIGRLNGLSKADAQRAAAGLLDQFGLSTAGGRLVKTYSGGMHRRLDLAVSIIGRPKVLFLDEPTTGLDPRSRRNLWLEVRRLVAGGTTVLLTTQYLEEVDELADSIVVLDGGKVIARGTSDELKKQVGGQVLEVEPADPARLADIEPALGDLVTGDVSVDHLAGRLEIVVDDPSAAAAAMRKLDESGIVVADLRLRRPSLDDVMLSLTGHRPEKPAEDAARGADDEAGGEQKAVPVEVAPPVRRPPRPLRLVTDAAVIARRNLVKLLRNPAYIAFSVIQPVIFVLLFTYVFGGAIIPGGDYISFVMPGIVVEMTGFAALATASGFNADLNNGVIDRFRSLPMAQSAVLTGRVAADALRIAGSVLIVAGVGALLGFRIHTGLWPGLAALAVICAFGVALVWVNIWIGLALRSSEAVQAASLVWLFPPVFASSAFVPPETMPGWLQSVVAVNPFTNVVDTIRALTSGGPVQDSLIKALAWSAGLIAVFSFLAIRRYQRTR